MKIKVLIIIFVVIISILFILSFFKLEENGKNGKYCQADEDCVPATCCHPDDCINLDNRPDCTGIGCTAECVPGTMDCGQGYCVCVDNQCKAMIE